MNQMTDAQIGYIAGIFDGEGWFVTNAKSGPNMSISMTDHDIIQKMFDWSGVGRLETPRKTNPGSTKTSLKWVVCKHDELFQLISLIKPMLSLRRSAKADEVLADIEARKERARWRKVHFICGHEKVPENTYHTNQGKTICRTCSLART